jgi:hypothetical protein
MRDWKELEEVTLRCACGEIFRGKHRTDFVTVEHETDRDCPNCGFRNRIKGVYYDKETFETEE